MNYGVKAIKELLD